ncbi:hypothetical protein [Bacillus infantis]|uniref:Uncharacterized protein n=1 Tax=Bacillus infantis TaxID=324767 RepID=A0A5D4RQW5_9BACI|nr:hypothetical protein [Bacillus infantis]TYS52208.1 hypothetical protein FZD51_01860 [Bacillus infantis]
MYNIGYSNSLFQFATTALRLVKLWRLEKEGKKGKQAAGKQKDSIFMEILSEGLSQLLNPFLWLGRLISRLWD